MTRAQRQTARQLAALIPGAEWGLDTYSAGEGGDVHYGDGSVLVHVRVPVRADSIDERGRRAVLGYRRVGSARIARGGYVLLVDLRDERP